MEATKKRTGKRPGLVLELRDAGKLCPECAAKAGSADFTNARLCTGCKKTYDLYVQQRYTSKQLQEKAKKQERLRMTAAHARAVLAQKRAAGEIVHYKIKKAHVTKTKPANKVPQYSNVLASLVEVRATHMKELMKHRAAIDEVDVAIKAIKKMK